MFKVWTIIFIFFYSLVIKAQVYRHLDVRTEGELSKEEVREISDLMSCQIENNFDLYANHLVEEVFPRVEEELFSLLRPHFSVNGKRVQVAEAVDSGDLFHVHVRTRLPKLSYHPLPFSGFLDSRNYHLQYHSFERVGVIKKKWMSELKEIDDPILAQWLTDVEKHKALLESQPDPGFGRFVDVLGESPIEEPLSDIQKNDFSKLLYSHLNSGSYRSFDYRIWLLDRLRTRFNFIDPKTIAFENVFSESRSLASYGFEFLILNSLEVPDHYQFANIYFEDRSDMPNEIEALIREAESKGLTHFLRGDGDFLKALEISSSGDDEFNVLKYAYRSQVSANKHRLFGWTERYVFSVSFSLNCK